MKSRLTAVTVCVALQSAIPTWSQLSKPNDYALIPVTTAFTGPVDTRAEGIDDYIKSEIGEAENPGIGHWYRAQWGACQGAGIR
jgi:hypothetical protein